MKPAQPTPTTPDPPVRMRALRFEDVPGILRLVRRAVDHGCRHHYDSSQRDAVYASYARNLFVEALGPLETIVAEERERVVAVAQLDPADDRLRALFVDAGLQQRGVGRALLADIERRVRARGGTRLHGAMALNAVSFYLQAGFRPCEGVDRLMSARLVVPILRMEKQLGVGSPSFVEHL